MTCNIQRKIYLNKGLSPSWAIYQSILQCYSECITWKRFLMHIWTLNYTLKTGWTWTSKYKNLFQNIWEGHIISVSFWEPIVALNPSDHSATSQRSLSFVRTKVHKWSKSYLCVTSHKWSKSYLCVTSGKSDY